MISNLFSIVLISAVSLRNYLKVVKQFLLIGKPSQRLAHTREFSAKSQLYLASKSLRNDFPYTGRGAVTLSGRRKNATKISELSRWLHPTAVHKLELALCGTNLKQYKLEKSFCGNDCQLVAIVGNFLYSEGLFCPVICLPQSYLFCKMRCSYLEKILKWPKNKHRPQAQD